MGVLLSIFQSIDVSDVYVNFKDAVPGAEEEKLCESVHELITNKGEIIMNALKNYQECSEIIKTALSDPTPEHERKAFDTVKPNVETVYNLHMISTELQGLFPELMNALATDNEKRSIQEQQAVCKTVANLFEFVLKIDELKLMKPGIQNDFAYYKRSLGKHADDEDLLVRDDNASTISMFIAQPIPLMNTLARSALKVAESNPFVTKTLATMANICLHLVKAGKFEEEATNLLCLRAMVGCIVLFDHIDAQGAFVKRSGINIKQAVSVLCKEYGHMTSLKNTLRFSTLHYSDESTPSAIVAMLEG